MKILAIRIKNLASLEGNTEIDFTAEPLCSAGIFAITGATGAGKSTILDALCLALYGKTPRYLQAKETGIEIRDVQGSTLSQGDVRSILRDGTADGFAEVDFKAIDGQDYRASWSVRRARNKAEGSMQSDSITLKNITLNSDIPGKKQETLNEVARLVGLNFEQFTRSVLLAQGDFTAFMKANRDEKSSLLEKLTGTHIYSEISKKIYEKYKLEEQQLRELELKKEGIVTLTAEELKVLSDDHEVLTSQIINLEKDLEKLNAAIGWHEQLTRFQIAHDTAHTSLQVATEAKTLALPRQQKLLMTEQAQQTRSWADALNHAQEQHTNKTIVFEELKETINKLIAQKEDVETRLKSAENNLTAKNKALTDAMPLLEQAKKLDTLIAEKKEQVEQLQEEAEQASIINTNHLTTLTTRQEEHRNVEANIKAITAWKTENIDRSAIAENKDLILSKLQDAQKFLDILHSSELDLTQLQEKIKTDEDQKTAIELNWNQQLASLENIKKNYESKAGELLLIPIEELNLTKTETEQQVENAIKAQAHWTLFYHAFTELEILNSKQQQDLTDEQTKQEALATLAQQLPLIKVQKDTAYQMLQQARLASAENVEALREALVDEEPCPVCGSTSHPYVSQNPQLENVLTQLEKSYKEKEQNYLLGHSQHDTLVKECSTLKQVIKDQSEAIAAKQLALADNKQAWEEFDSAKESNAIADAKKAEWLEENLQALKSKQAELLAQIKAYTEKKQQLEATRTEIDQLKDHTDKLANQIKDIQNRLAVYQEQQSSKTKEQAKATTDLDGVATLLSPYFTTADWMTNWKIAPVAFVERIDSFARNWKENDEKLEQYTRQQAALNATLKELEIQAKNIAIEADKKREAHSAQHQIYLNLVEQRKAIFGGQPVAVTENLLKQAIDEAQQQLEQLKTQQQQLTIESTKAHTQREALTAALMALETEAQKAVKKMQDWLDDYNQKNGQSLSIATLHELLALSNDWILTERAELQTIEEAVNKANTILSERKQAMDNHLQHAVAEQALEELLVLNVVAKTEVEQKKHQKGENSFRLQQDEANKNKIGDLLKKITVQAAISENWSKLNEIIGSADGKKFRQIAQEYTLDVLLGYANIHLQALTSRYKIERIPTSLGLQVVDQDMGDEVRTVYSLSGGESFLVSLALALGLASLSSSRMKVESLFIDEGFGSLDPTTLNIAMDALERLHNQGRKVGVISHVQEMTERIPVQIKVSKQQSGKSLVEVVGI
ncbi:MAG: AAA family ATPase [Legionellaceae bacterium]|nr:AAA family ATPase [Legionellaceae bacterium]